MQIKSLIQPQKTNELKLQTQQQEISDAIEKGKKNLEDYKESELNLEKIKKTEDEAQLRVSALLLQEEELNKVLKFKEAKVIESNKIIEEANSIKSQIEFDKSEHNRLACELDEIKKKNEPVLAKIITEEKYLTSLTEALAALRLDILEIGKSKEKEAENLVEFKKEIDTKKEEKSKELKEIAEKYDSIILDISNKKEAALNEVKLKEEQLELDREKIIGEAKNEKEILLLDIKKLSTDKESKNKDFLEISLKYDGIITEINTKNNLLDKRENDLVVREKLIKEREVQLEDYKKVLLVDLYKKAKAKQLELDDEIIKQLTGV